MVNTGKPSGACATCKRRKIKCDETIPSCLRCTVSGRQCPGYQQKGPVRFCDETAKAKSRVAAKRARISTVSKKKDTSSLSPPTRADARCGTLQRKLNTPSSQDVAVNLLFQHFIPQPNAIRRGVFLSALPRIYQDSVSVSPLRLATSAVALYMLGRFPDMANLRTLAVTQYSHALRSLAYAVGDPEEAKCDATVMCGMLVVFFETLVNDQKRVGPAYKEHHNGLAKLLQNRGDEQFKSADSCTLYRSIRSQIVLPCLHNSETMPDYWKRDFTSDLSRRDAPSFGSAWASRLAVQATSLRERSMNLLTTRDRLPSSSTSASDFSSDSDCPSNTSNSQSHTLLAADLLVEACAFDQNFLATWKSIFTSSTDCDAATLPVRTPRQPDSPHLWQGRIDTYDGLSFALLFNSFRMTRIYIQSVVIRCLAILAEGNEAAMTANPLYHSACSIAQAMVDDICACVPNYLGEDLVAEMTPGPDGRIDEKARIKLIEKGLGAYLMMWPLYAGASVETIPSQQREWLKGRLRFLTEHHGVSIAAVLAGHPPSTIYGDRGKEAWFDGHHISDMKTPQGLVSPANGRWSRTISMGPSERGLPR